MPSRHRLYCLALFPLLAWSVTGCEREQPYGSVEGVVTLDGKPLTKVEVVFLPDPEKGGKGARSASLTDERGHFRIANDAGRMGAPVGFHRVCILDMTERERGPGPVIVAPDETSKGLLGVKAPADAKAGPAPPAGSTKPKGRFPRAYTTAIETPFRDIEVKEGDQIINLDLKSNR